MGDTMFVNIKSFTYVGLETRNVDVEVNIFSRGLPGFEIVGLPSKSIEESRYRIKTALLNLKVPFPNKKIIVNLAPADIKKIGSFYDVPIAVGILCAIYDICVPNDSSFFGEVSLDGNVRYTRGALLFVLHAQSEGLKKVFVPKDCLNEVSTIDGLEIFGVTNLFEIVEHLSKTKLISSQINTFYSELVSQKINSTGDLTFSSIVGHQNAKNALSICAAGGHNLLMVGSPGSGKTLLARSLISILPPLSEEESLEVTKIYSCVGKLLPNQGLLVRRPFRNPHHTISYSGMLGGGNTNITPGEISLAHRGVLFMDEFSEFSRTVVESLRQPLEDGFISIARSGGALTFPSRFMLIAACNPCGCGYLGHPTIPCTCNPHQISLYTKKLTGPLMDRVDMHINVFSVDPSSINNSNVEYTSLSDYICKIKVARELQRKRFLKYSSIHFNSEMNLSQIKEFCKLDYVGISLLNKVANKFNFSTRTYFKLLKLSRTVADMEGAFNINSDHLTQAIQYRCRLSS